MPVTLGYWKIRALAQPIRLLLKYTKTDFEDIRYEQGDAPEFSREAWTSVKFTLGLDFPNLPYLIDGNIKITQSNAILRYIADKHDMCGKTTAERATVNMLESEAMDFKTGFIRHCFNPNMESMKADFVKNIRMKLENFSKFLGSKPWFVGDTITFVDFPLYETMDTLRMFDPNLFNGLDNLKEFLARFEALPAIKEYMTSSEFMRYPVYMKEAHWGGK